jgi:hypothetical protein
MHAIYKYLFIFLKQNKYLFYIEDTTIQMILGGSAQILTEAVTNSNRLIKYLAINGRRSFLITEAVIFVRLPNQLIEAVKK